MLSLSARIRTDIERRIVSGEWQAGHRIPFEHELTAQYACSRMTVNKALSALASTGLIVRRRKAGSFVAPQPGEQALMEIQDFAEEAARRGLPYHHQILRRQVEKLDTLRARAWNLKRACTVLHVECLHFIDAIPMAYEDRIIVIPMAPGVLDETFAQTPPGTWLLRSVPWTEAEHVLYARSADAALAALLAIPEAAACLVLERRTWYLGKMVTDVRISYPGERHRLVGRFSRTANAT